MQYQVKFDGNDRLRIVDAENPIGAVYRAGNRSIHGARVSCQEFDGDLIVEYTIQCDVVVKRANTGVKTTRVCATVRPV